MGQSVALDSTDRSSTAILSQLRASLIETPCGWMGYTGINETVFQLKLGYTDPNLLRHELGFDDHTTEENWHPELRQRLHAYANGKRVSFKDIRCFMPPQTEFQRRVTRFVKEIPYGIIMGYGEVAHEVGYPRAARAVGTVMSSNRIPLIIPCHRVVAAGGRLGNYTSPRGTEMKRWLLELEGAALLTKPR